MQMRPSRSCPECRQHSDYIVPSVIWVEDKEEKELLFRMYKENTGQKQCKYYRVRAGSQFAIG